MSSDYIPFSPPSIGADEIDEVVDTLHSDWLTTGPKTRRFETEFRDYLQAPGALALNSCTAGLHLSLASLGIGEGDEVITTPMTFAATANVIEHVGARVVLADVQPDTLNIDPDQVAAKVTARTRAIMPVHYAGHPADMDEIDAIAEQHGLYVIEDAAHALPAAYRGQPIGSRNHLTAFSFYATKNMTTAEGGMLTGPTEVLDQARNLSLHGMSREAWRRYEQGGTWKYDIVAPGFKYNMTDIQAALGIHQLRRLAGFHQRRLEIVRQYNEAFSAQGLLAVPEQRPYVSHAWHLYVLRLVTDRVAVTRDQVISELQQRNIATSVHFIPIHLHSFYAGKYGFAPEDFPVALDSYQRMLSLPLNPRLTDTEIGRVIDAVVDVVSAGQYRMAA